MIEIQEEEERRNERVVEEAAHVSMCADLSEEMGQAGSSVMLTPSIQLHHITYLSLII